MKKEPDEEVTSFTTSVMDDYVLYPFDVWGSAAHCMMLERVGLLEGTESAAILEGLRTIMRELTEGTIDPSSHEDIHSLVESRLHELIGETAGKLHAGRSRNDQIVLDERLFLREAMVTVGHEITTLLHALLDKAVTYPKLVMPGYTHLQPAQPVLFSHHMMAYFAMFRRDAERLRDALPRVNILPLGAAALAGTNLPIDRAETARFLAFPTVQGNSMDIVADRDFILEVVGHCALAALHLSRLAEEIVLWVSPGFGFLEIDDAFTTGSSIMPQKKNPDVAELIRGKSGESVSGWLSLAVTLKGLPLTYNRDLQQDKAPMFRVMREVTDSLHLAARLVDHITLREDTIARALQEGFLTATDIAEYLVEQGIPFRKAHSLVGALVRDLASQGRTLAELRKEDLASVSEGFYEDILVFSDPAQSVERKRSYGGTAPGEVARQVQEGRMFIEREEERLAELRLQWKKSFMKIFPGEEDVMRG